MNSQPQSIIVPGVDWIESAEDHGLNVPEPGQRRWGRPCGQGHGVPHPEVAGLLDCDTDSVFKAGFGLIPHKISRLRSDNEKKYNISDFKKSYPHIELEEPVNSSNIKLAIDLLNTLPPRMLEHIKKISFGELQFPSHP